MPQKHEISKLDEKGHGIAGDLHVKFCYPGDVIEAELTNRRKKTGRLISLIHPSPFRQHPPCPYFGKCGGCPWQGLKYEAQLKFKEEKVKNLFGECLPIVPSPEIYFYRNRMEDETDFLVGRREDTLIRLDGELKIARRKIILDQSVLLAKNLTMFF